MSLWQLWLIYHKASASTSFYLIWLQVGCEGADGPDTLRWDVESTFALLGDTR